MHFEIQDLGQSAGRERFRVSTSGYMYAVLDDSRREWIAAHWHPSGRSHHIEPHWHVGSLALAPSGVFLERSPIPSPRVSFESMVRWAIENLPEVEPVREDWDAVLRESEARFDEYKTW
ncbi:hypothetical protein [Marmoricola sp. RAF53]|uniref:hypothetical protein n=1 Tax=Marmoricola sp. RAF53 TaxID=3233059 RepID=UPI003F9BBA56